MQQKILLLILSISLLIGCQSDVRYVQTDRLPSYGWAADSVLRFDVPVTDTLLSVDIEMDVYHHTCYPYQNLWLFVSQYHDGAWVWTDTIEAYLADETGQWFGTGYRTKDMRLAYRTNYRFPVCGTYTFTVQQGMRTDTLVGIQAVGWTIRRADGQE